MSAQISAEFAAQALLERDAGLPITVLVATDEVAKAKMEIGFIKARRDVF